MVMLLIATELRKIVHGRRVAGIKSASNECKMVNELQNTLYLASRVFPPREIPDAHWFIRIYACVNCMTASGTQLIVVPPELIFFSNIFYYFYIEQIVLMNIITVSITQS